MASVTNFSDEGSFSGSVVRIDEGKLRVYVGQVVRAGVIEVDHAADHLIKHRPVADGIKRPIIVTYLCQYQNAPFSPPLFASRFLFSRRHPPDLGGSTGELAAAASFGAMKQGAKRSLFGT
jgi:hypothetical protein